MATTADQLVLAREYDRVIAQNRISLEIDPRHPFSRRALGIVYALKGMFPEAEGELRRVADAVPHVPDFRADLAYALALRRPPGGGAADPARGRVAPRRTAEARRGVLHRARARGAR